MHTTQDPTTVDLAAAAAELEAMAADRCGYCGTEVDRSTPQGEAEGQHHDNAECQAPR